MSRGNYHNYYKKSEGCYMFLKKIMLQKILILLIILITNIVYADNKFAVVDADKIFTESKPAKIIQATLSNKFSPIQLSVQNFGKSVMAEQKQLQQAMQTMPNNQQYIAKLQEKYQKDQELLQKRIYNTQQAMQKVQETIISSFMKKTNIIIKQFAYDQNLDFIFLSNQVAFVKKDKYDITDSIIDKINTQISVDSMVNQINKTVINIDQDPRNYNTNTNVSARNNVANVNSQPNSATSSVKKFS